MPKILIVDDDRATSTLLRTLFTIENYDGVLCPRPEQVLSVAAHEKPDLILMDVHLAGIDSITILNQIRANQDLKSMPVVMTSGMDVEERCMRAGASAFMLKPFKPAELLDVVKRLVTTHAATN